MKHYQRKYARNRFRRNRRHLYHHSASLNGSRKNGSQTAKERERELAAIQEEQERMQQQTEWMRQCLPKVPFPAIIGRPRLDFGLASFLIYVKDRMIRHGDPAAGDVLKFLRPRPLVQVKKGKLLLQ